MKSFTFRFVIAVLTAALVVPISYAQDDREGCKDHPLLSRMSGFFIQRCTDEAFSSHKFQTPEGNIPIEGHLTFLEYGLLEGEPKVSNLELIRNYTSAVTAIGGEVTYEGRYSASMKTIVGHTDMTGSFEHNVDLSNRRAIAVIDALVTDNGISAERLAPRGVGPFAPIGSNDNETGRTLNRRVELVKR